MILNKANYDSYIKRKGKDFLNSSLANDLKNNKISYFEIFDNNNFINSFVVYDYQNNWLAIPVHDKISILDNKRLINFILSELKNYYKYVTLIISEEFISRIKTAQQMGFKKIGIEKQNNFNYVKLKKELVII